MRIRRFQRRRRCMKALLCESRWMNERTLFGLCIQVVGLFLFYKGYSNLADALMENVGLATQSELWGFASLCFLFFGILHYLLGIFFILGGGVTYNLKFPKGTNDEHEKRDWKGTRIRLIWTFGGQHDCREYAALIRPLWRSFFPAKITR